MMTIEAASPLYQTENNVEEESYSQQTEQESHDDEASDSRQADQYVHTPAGTSAPSPARTTTTGVSTSAQAIDDEQECHDDDNNHVREELDPEQRNQDQMIKELASPLHHTTSVGTSAHITVKDEEEEELDSQQTKQESHDDEASDSRQADQQPDDERKANDVDVDAGEKCSVLDVDRLGANINSAMDVTGAMGSLFPKLGELLVGEYKLQKGVKDDIESLKREMKSMHPALIKVAEVPRDQLDPEVKIWADELRELSYDMEDVVDNFLVCIEGSDATNNSHKLKELMQKMANLFPKCKTRHQIANAIEVIKNRVEEIADRRVKYKVDDVIATAVSKSEVDPRMLALYKDQKELVGIEGARDELTKRLTDGDDGDVSNQQLKIVSIFGPGGIGKTTLAKAVYDRLQAQYVHKAFVRVGLNAEVKKVLMDILVELGKKRPVGDVATLAEWQLIDKLRKLLEDVRYFIVIDNIRDLEAWKKIKCVLLDNNCGSRIITTTRILEVATNTNDVYKLEPLSDDLSEELFYTRLFGGKDKRPDDIPSEVSKKILQKCGGVPLAIIAIASLLLGKPMEDWSKVYNSIGFGNGDNTDVEDTGNILLFSYYDLPFYLRPCLLHLAIFPEDSLIMKDTLIWKWVAEDFVSEEPGIGLFEIGERYFNELINRSMILPVEHNEERDVIFGCRVHNMVLDMIWLLSKEQNFVTILHSNGKYSSSESNARRLAVQTRDEEQHNHLANTSMPKLRSCYASMCHASMMPPLSSFPALRVLDIENCILMENCHLKHLERLQQLRYLSLENTGISELPEGIGDLKFLQTLDLRNTKIKELPHGTGLLTKLKRLRADDREGVSIRVPNWIGNLTSLEELSLSTTGECSIFVKELGKLTELRVLICHLRGQLNERSKKTFVESICKLRKIEVLRLQDFYGWSILEADTYWKGYKPPRQLRDLDISSYDFSRLPAWINSLLLPNLSNLEVSAWIRLEKEDVVNLGRLPGLLKLKDYWIPAGMEFPDGAFPKLRSCGIDAPFRFLQGSMQSLESISFDTMGLFNDAVIDFDFIGTLGNLPSLRVVCAHMDCGGARASDVEKMEAVVRQAIDTHPNRPTLHLSRRDQDEMIKEPDSPLHHTTSVIVEESDSQQIEQECSVLDDHPNHAVPHLSVGTSAPSPARTTTTGVSTSAQAISDDNEEEEESQADRQEQRADEREEAEDGSAEAAAPESPHTVDVASLAESGVAAAGTPAPVPARRTWRRWACFSCLNSGSSSSD